MKTAGIAKLKAELSEYLARVRSGEEIIITDRGKPIAKLLPLGSREIGIPESLLSLEKEGLVKIGRGGIPSDFWKIRRPEDKTGRALKALLDERESGR